MFDEIVIRGKIAKYFAETKKFSAPQIPVEVEKCVQSLTLWCSRYAKDKEHGDALRNTALEGLLE